MKRLILVGGTMGVGKTARALRLRARAFQPHSIPAQRGCPAMREHCIAP